MEALQDVLAGVRHEVDRRVVTAEDHLHTLQPHHAVGLRPAAVVADGHADEAAEHPPHAEAEIAHVEVTLLEVLERPRRLGLGMPRQVDLAVLADDASCGIDQD